MKRVAATKKPAPMDGSDRTPQLAARFQRVWPQAILILSLTVTASWMVLLGYGLVELVEMAL
jgi:hypothetical protein